jgi:hypothetical protein
MGFRHLTSTLINNVAQWTLVKYLPLLDTSFWRVDTIPLVHKRHLFVPNKKPDSLRLKQYHSPTDLLQTSTLFILIRSKIVKQQ